MSVEPSGPAGNTENAAPDRAAPEVTPQAASQDPVTQRREARERGDRNAIVVASRALWQRLMRSSDSGDDGATSVLIADLRAERTVGGAEGDVSYQALCDSTLGLVHTRRGNFEAGEDAYRSAVRGYRSLENDAEIAGVRYHLGCLYAQSGRTADARRQFQAALSTFREKKMGAWFAQANLRLAETLAPGDAQHIRHLKDALGVFVGAKRDREAADCATKLADSYAHAGNKKVAEQLYHEASNLYEKVAAPAAHADVLVRTAFFLSHHQRDREAEFYFSLALDAGLSAGAIPLVALCDAGTALAWDRISLMSYSRDSILTHSVALMLPSLLYFDAVSPALDTPGENPEASWHGILSDLLSWCAAALPRNEHTEPLHNEIAKFAADRGYMTSPAEPPRRRLRRYRIATPDVMPRLAELHRLLRTSTVPAAQNWPAESASEDLRQYARVARCRYSPAVSDGNRGGDSL
ncbi:tetratricopeptide repeat protein [Hoyosella subflava]|uniref:TPR repeat protein n=1 Tax=Hoyosella subflava (strain DSM 45089 / JCM 17490 / NBRC 109087 / DQS3-9A1) TaxID=443218 RepID=F6EKE7_HOYSD|nr:tetratricopeptide repeat protein [Hoyosella subflava]AEF39118.1 TPR repeat protein [Hoyosella subflava DQS3-9A1]